MVKIALVALMVLIASPAFAAPQTNMSWANPVIAAGQPTPTGILISKGATAGGTFTPLHNLAPTAVSDIDTTIALGVPVCYKIQWVYALGNSNGLTACGTPAIGPDGTTFSIIFSNPAP